MAASLENLRAGDFFLLVESGQPYRDQGGAAERTKLARWCLVRARGEAGEPAYALPIGYLFGNMLHPPDGPALGSASPSPEPPMVSVVATRLRPPPADGSVVHFFGNV